MKNLFYCLERGFVGDLSAQMCFGEQFGAMRNIRKEIGAFDIGAVP